MQFLSCACLFRYVEVRSRPLTDTIRTGDIMLSLASTADIELTSSQHDNGVCIEDRVIFTCSVTGIGRVEWAVQSLNTFREDIIVFRIHEDEPGSVLDPDPFPEVVNVTLISADQSPLHPDLGNVSSQITVLVTSNTLDKHVYCGNGRLKEDEAPSKDLNLPGSLLLSLFHYSTTFITL